MVKIQTALISVYDKTGLVDFVKGLHAQGIRVLSTGGTAQLLKNSGIPVTEVSDYTGFPEILDGRVKTLHPAIYGGLLALRDKPEHMAELKRHKTVPIDMVVANLYPFDKVTQRRNVAMDEAIENIDIGGPAMLRAAAKNFKSVAVVCSPGRYPEVLKELDVNSGILSDSVLSNLAIEAFRHTAQYDAMIFEFLSNRLKSGSLSRLARDLTLRYTKVQDLRYGENPHQAAAFYRDSDKKTGLPCLRQLHGKELSFNNLLDINAALNIAADFEQPAAAIVKHNNPTGVAEASTSGEAFSLAWKCDPVSAFGGIIGLNRKVDSKTARLIEQSGFMECVVAPDYDAAALKILTKKKNIRIIQMDPKQFPRRQGFDFRQVEGGLLLQESDRKTLEPAELKFVTKKKPTRKQIDTMLFGWKVVRHIRSNAVILVKDKRTVGIGCGQTSRVESTMLAVKKAGKNARGALLVSEAFIPKTDNVRLAAKAGIKAIIQTGGSVADPDVIKGADRAGIAMVMTGVRHFKH